MLAYHLLALSTCTPTEIKAARDIPGKTWVDGTWSPCVAAALLTPLKRGPKTKGPQSLDYKAHPLLLKDPEMPSTFIGTFSRQDVMRMRRRVQRWLASPRPRYRGQTFRDVKRIEFHWLSHPIFYKTEYLKGLLAMFNTVLERGSTVTLNYYGA